MGEIDWMVERRAALLQRPPHRHPEHGVRRAVTNGNVADGYLEGARVHEDGQLVDAATLRFQGSIQIVPATAG